MQKIFSSSQIKALDQYTIKNEPIASLQLMERACKAFVEWFVIHIPADKKIAVVCGTGNNGGDGLGIARLLREWHYAVSVWIVKGESTESEDFIANRQRLPEKIIVRFFEGTEENPFSKEDIIIDAIFGTGLSRAVQGVYKNAIESINQSSKTIVAVDVPSGLRIDEHSTGAIVQADYTLTFQQPKLAFLQPENAHYVGEWHVLDIGLNREFIESEKSNYFLLTKKVVRKMLQPRQKFSHKGTYGHAWIVAGSLGKMGAAVLASRAALRAGSGLVTVHAPQIGYTILQASVPEAMMSVDEQEHFITMIPMHKQDQTFGIGPGIGLHEKTIQAFESLLQNNKAPMVIDADALNILAKHPQLIKQIPAASILTPHPKELERLIGSWTDDFDKLEKLKMWTSQIQSYVVLKGAYSAIATPEQEIYFNPTGNPGMATGGSGDVLTGILTGLLAQGYSSFQTCVLGVYLHGLAGDLAVREGDANSLIASDLIEHLPLAFRSLNR